MRQEIKEYGEIFIEKLAGFIRNEKAEAIGGYGLTEKEYNAVITETFYLLGRKHKELKKKAGIK